VTISASLNGHTTTAKLTIVDGGNGGNGGGGSQQ